MHWRVLVSAAVLVLAVTPVATQPKGCEADGKIQFICGITSPEDLVPVPRSEWVVASGYVRGGVSLVNTKTFAATQVFPVAKPVERFDRTTYSQCPGPVDPGEKEKLSAHGLAIRPGSDRVHTIYLVHHGFRESIEVFEIDTRPATPAVTWIGCVIAPDPIGLNSVRALPDGGFIATNFLARNVTPENRLRMLEGDKNGELWEWHAAGGWKKVPGSESSGANGIEISNDGKWYYVAAWGSQSFFRLSRGAASPTRDEIRLGFRVDNIRWTRDGSLYATGQTGSREVPETASVVVKINPETLAVREVYRRRDDATFRFGTVAVEVGNELWIGSYQGDRIAVVPAP